MRAVLADTGPLYAANDESDQHHSRALRELQHFARDKREIVIAYPTLLECYSLLLFRLGRQASFDWLSEISTVPLVNPKPEDYARAVVTVRTLSDQNLTLVDATLAALASRLKIEVWTYDHHFDLMRVPVWR
jgi:predicted nucleic acid-binding protein